MAWPIHPISWFLPQRVGWPCLDRSALKRTPMLDFNSFSIMFYYIISTTYEKIGDLFCPVIFLDFRTVCVRMFLQKYFNPFVSSGYGSKHNLSICWNVSEKWFAFLSMKIGHYLQKNIKSMSKSVEVVTLSSPVRLGQGQPSTSQDQWGINGFANEQQRVNDS